MHPYMTTITCGRPERGVRANSCGTFQCITKVLSKVSYLLTARFRVPSHRDSLTWGMWDISPCFAMWFPNSRGFTVRVMVAFFDAASASARPVLQRTTFVRRFIRALKLCKWHVSDDDEENH